MRYGPLDTLSNLPSAITFEITTRCNLTCVMCAHGSPMGMPQKRDAPNDMITMVLEQLDKLDEVHPTGVGEPMMAPGFWKIVDALEDRLTPVLTFNTNGILLTEQNVARISRVAIGRINVSIDAANELSYRRIRGGDMRKTLNGLDRLVLAVNNMPQVDRVRVAISMVLMRENIEEASDFVRLAHAHGVRAVYFEHMLDIHDPNAAWIIKKDNFIFNYKEQRLCNDPSYSDKHICKALDVADDLGIVIESPELLFLPENAHHLNRPCMTGAIAGIFEKVLQ
jgi:MoaA/NifB/PqqE/SkfB family radical SAM enzyme